MSGKLLIFGGTSESVSLAKELSARDYSVTISVATDYGALMLKELPITVRVGRLDSAGMVSLMREGFDAVIDATHPYAVEATATILAAARETELRVERLVRPAETTSDERISVQTIAEAAQWLDKLDGNVLLTTGSKELLPFTELKDYRERIWVRILASETSLHQVLSLGFPANHVIAMHGPFSEELNEAMLRQFQIRVLVTKNSGTAGGFVEKMAAAKRVGAQVIVVERPVQENGLTLDEMLEKYRKLREL